MFLSFGFLQFLLLYIYFISSHRIGLFYSEYFEKNRIWNCVICDFLKKLESDSFTQKLELVVQGSEYNNCFQLKQFKTYFLFLTFPQSNLEQNLVKKWDGNLQTRNAPCQNSSKQAKESSFYPKFVCNLESQYDYSRRL